MLFQIESMWQILGWCLVFAGLIITNEIARRTKKGGIAIFGVILGALTVYFIVIAVCAGLGMPWALKNQTYLYMNSWFHYAKLYAACAGCIGFMMLKYKEGLGKYDWFKPFPFVIVAINIMIANFSDVESAIKGAQAVANGGASVMGGGWWYSSEGVWLYGGWWNWLNALAGLLNIFCMTGWWGIYSSKKHDDMLWPDMTIWYIVAYDVWNFTYTYLNLPTHSWYCGLALLLAPTVAALMWNKGGWIQNRANTLGIWCMFAQTVPLFQIAAPFSVLPTIYAGQYRYALEMTAGTAPAAADPRAQGLFAILSFAINVLCLGVVIKRSIALKRNPYKQEIFVGTKDYKEAMARAE